MSAPLHLPSAAAGPGVEATTLAPSVAVPASAAAHRRARARAAEFWLQGLSDGRDARHEAPGWQDLARLPEWVHVLAPAARTAYRARVATACGVLWHAPAWRRCVSPGPLQALSVRLGADRLDALLHARVEGPGQQLPPAEECLDAMGHAGQLVLLSTLPRVWAPAIAQAMGWSRSLDELARVPPPEETPRTVALATRIVGVALDTLALAPPPAPATGGGA